MDERKLRVFLEVARELSFSRAADRLQLSQPAVSQSVASLESDVGARLLDRSSNRVAVTDAGRALVEHAERVLAEIAELRRRVTTANDDAHQELQLAASLTVANYVLPPVLTRVRLANPRLRLEMEVANSERVLAALRAGTIDIGLVETPVMEAPDLDIRSFRSDELVVVASGQHRWRRVNEVDVGDFAAEPLIVREDGSGTRQVAEAYLRAAGVDCSSLNVVAVISQIEAIKACVEAGMAVAILSLSSIRKELRLGTVIARPLRGVTMARDMSYLTLANARRSAIAETFLGVLEHEAA